jgi:hypothetical protein
VNSLINESVEKQPLSLTLSPRYAAGRGNQSV